MTRIERIAFLLEHYHDVLSGLWDSRSGAGGVMLMCTAWNSPSYQELEHLLPQLRADEPRLYRAVVAVFVHPRFVRRAVCPKCSHVAPPRLVGEVHAHDRGKPSAFVARMVRVPLYEVEAADVDGAIAWLDAQWRGDPSVPAELLPLVAVA